MYMGQGEWSVHQTGLTPTFMQLHVMSLKATVNWSREPKSVFVWRTEPPLNLRISLLKEDETQTGRFNHQMSITNQAAGQRYRYHSELSQTNCQEESEEKVWRWLVAERGVTFNEGDVFLSRVSCFKARSSLKLKDLSGVEKYFLWLRHQLATHCFISNIQPNVHTRAPLGLNCRWVGVHSKCGVVR